MVSSFFDEEPGWFLSEGLEAELVKELKSHLGGEFSEDFDPKEALDIVSGLWWY